MENVEKVSIMEKYRRNDVEPGFAIFNLEKGWFPHWSYVISYPERPEAGGASSFESSVSKLQNFVENYILLVVETFLNR